MSKISSGGCVCGNVRYEFKGQPLAMFNCHCHTCQKVSGGPYVPVVLVLSEGFRVTQGALRYHTTDKVKGGLHKRGFCADCGTRMTGGEAPDTPSRWLAVTASSLDDPTIYKPLYDIFASHAQPWDLMDGSLLKHPEYPPQ